MMSRQVCVPQDDLAHPVTEILLTTGELKKGIVRDRRTTARQREEPRLQRRWPRGQQQQASQAHARNILISLN